MSRNAATRPYGSARRGAARGDELHPGGRQARERGVEVVHLEEEPGAQTGVLLDRADGPRPIMTAWT
jgi:hypothetical protein